MAVVIQFRLKKHMEDAHIDWLGAKTQQTKRAYAHDFATFMSWLDTKSYTLDTIKLHQLKEFQRDMSGVAGCKRLLSAVRSFFKYCYNQGFTESNIGRCLIIPRQFAVLKERKLTRTQIDNIIAASKGKTILLTKLLFYLGLRINEARLLHCDDITEVERCLLFRVVGKGNKIRTVKLGQQKSCEVKPLLPKSGYVFSGPCGPISTNSAYKRVKVAARRAQLPFVSGHWLRHGFCTLALLSKAPLQSVSAAMGHSSLAITSRYAHAGEDAVSTFL